MSHPIPSPDPAESALIRELAAGNPAALDDFYAHYGPRVFSYLVAWLDSRPLAEEVLQDVMLAAWRSAPGFRGDSKVLTWLLTIARNRAINAVRRRSLPQVALSDDLNLANGDTSPLERLLRQGEHEVVRETLDRLPVHLREVLVLVFYQQLTESEVAAVLGIPVGTVKSRLHRAKDKMRSALQSEARL